MLKCETFVEVTQLPKPPPQADGESGQGGENGTAKTLFQEGPGGGKGGEKDIAESKFSGTMLL